jgi:hypothetical protein
MWSGNFGRRLGLGLGGLEEEGMACSFGGTFCLLHSDSVGGGWVAGSCSPGFFMTIRLLFWCGFGFGFVFSEAFGAVLGLWSSFGLAIVRVWYGVVVTAVKEDISGLSYCYLLCMSYV